ncbi:primosomal protein DnaI [Aquibacillus kalidii]|uniref:primosomal protein DnaI n=1 Tax=Aquibacillus kalidii TaxID=2762597 RepID=UPI001646499E|nr:primosomal protein DnaI [Aquibacillus kalidii]
MESIQESLKKWMRDNKNFQENYNKIKNALIHDPEIEGILRENPEMSDQDINRNLMKFYEYKTQSKNCADCPSLEKCINILPGYTPHLSVESNDVHLAYEKCYKKEIHEDQNRRQSLVKSLYMPKDILEASFDNLDRHEETRYEAIREAASYIQNISSEQFEKGLYFYGPFGVGKTYLLGAIANKLAEKRISTMLIYMPEFVREMKSSLKDDSVNKKMEEFKKVQVLMIDDIGAESLSAWFRDEILGSILQYRMMERLPVFFTSNYSLKQLEHHLATSTRGDTEEVKAGRIIERIKQVSKEVSLFGINRRDL